MRKLVGLGVPVLVGGVVHPVVVEAEPVDEPDAAPGAVDPAVAYLMDEYGLSESAATARMARMAELGALIDELGASYGPVWAGAWIDHEAGGEATIAVTSEEAVTEIQRGPAAGIDDVVVVQRDLPVSVLGETVDALAAELSSIAAEHDVFPGELFQGGVDVQGNQVVIEVAEQPTAADPIAFAEARAAVSAVAEQRADGRSPVTVRSVPSLFSEEAACLPDACHPLHGGTTADPIGCTYGFTFKGSNDATYVSTAGHCDSTIYSHMGLEVGPTWGSVYIGSIDLQTVLVLDAPTWKPNNEIRRGGNVIFTITSQVTDPRASLEGDVLCTVGVGREHFSSLSTEQCGELSNYHWTFGGGSRYARMNDVATCPGDSGGPVFRPSDHRAFGTISGYQDDDPGGCEGDNDLIFGWVQYAEERFADDGMPRQILLTHINW